MKTILLAILAVAAAAPSFGQIYGARRYTQRIQPQVRPAPPAARPAAPAPQQTAPAQPAAITPPPPAPVYPQYRPSIAAPTVSKPADPAKAAAEKAKNDEKQFEFFKRRAEEGSDHAEYELGVRYLAGRGVAADEKLGREWLTKAASHGNTQATKKLTELGNDSGNVPAAAAATLEPAKPVEEK